MPNTRGVLHNVVQPSMLCHHPAINHADQARAPELPGEDVQLEPEFVLASSTCRSPCLGFAEGTGTLAQPAAQGAKCLRKGAGMACSGVVPKCCFTCWATRCASAAHVHMGFTPDAVGKAEVSATKRPKTSQVSPEGLTAPSLGEAAIRQVPI